MAINMGQRLLVLFFWVSSLFAGEPFDFTMKFMDPQGKKVTLAPFKGRPTLIVYHSLGCSKCKLAIQNLRTSKDLGCLSVVGIVSGGDTEKEYKSDTTRTFPDFYDKWKMLKERYSIAFTPSFFVLNAGGELVYWQERYPAESGSDFFEILRRMACKEPSFTTVMKKKYYGDAVCAPCHKGIWNWWDSSSHSKAYLDVAKRYFSGKGFRPEMAVRIPPETLKVTTVGFGEPTGYSPQIHQRHLTGVQCESCHGPGGPHGGKKVSDYEMVCLRCHTSSRDPLFYFSTGLKKLNHPKERR